MLFTAEESQQLARDIVIQMTHHPETVDLMSWGKTDECGTTACVAGWAALLSGHAKYDEHGLLGLFGTAQEEYGRSGFQSFGRHALGLDADLAYHLFHNTDETHAVEILSLVAEGKELWVFQNDWRVSIHASARV